MNIFNNPDLKYNYEGNGDMNDFTDPFSNVIKIEDVVCRDCGKTFQIHAQYDKNGVPVSFRAKYCTDCNMKPKITGANGSLGTNIVSASIPQKNVEGLINDLSALSVGIEESYNEFQSFKKDAEHSIELNKNAVEDKLYSHNKRIDDNKLNLDVFKSAQNMINERHFNHIKKLTRESMIMFFMVILLFVIDLATIWCYIRK